jgi:ABC-type branched-subunit amino acid transport system substrate-binding protein
MKKAILFLFLFCNVSVMSFAQNISATRHKMAIFTPLYLDEAFDGDGNFSYSGNSFPKNSIQGLEFYHGAAMAIDSLNALNLPLDIYVYDTKSKRESIEQQFSKCTADGVEMIIANSSVGELSKLATLAADKKITVINAMVPNDGNATANPYFVILNPTLQTQVEGVYHYIKTNFPGQEVVFFTKKGTSENYIKAAFEGSNKINKLALHVKFVDMSDSVSTTQINNAFDKTKPALCVIGSLDTYFAGAILKNLSLLSKNYSNTVAIGMPTLENTSLSKSEFKNVEIVYSTPFYNPKTDVISKNIMAYYNKKMYARPSDLVFRAFAVTYHFGRLLSMYGNNISASFNNRIYKVFYDFDIQAMPDSQKLDYFENKKLFFLKFLNGSLKQVN